MKCVHTSDTRGYCTKQVSLTIGRVSFSCQMGVVPHPHRERLSHLSLIVVGRTDHTPEKAQVATHIKHNWQDLPLGPGELAYLTKQDPTWTRQAASKGPIISW